MVVSFKTSACSLSLQVVFFIQKRVYMYIISVFAQLHVILFLELCLALQVYKFLSMQQNALKCTMCIT